MNTGDHLGHESNGQYDGPDKAKANSIGVESTNERSRVVRPWRASLLLGGTIALTALVCHIATFSHAPASAINSVVHAAIWIALASIPPLWLKPVLRNGAAFQLAVVAWRLGAILPAAASSRYEPEESRNYFLIVLLACYFVALPLESWLLVRDVQRNEP